MKFKEGQIFITSKEGKLGGENFPKGTEVEIVYVDEPNGELGCRIAGWRGHSLGGLIPPTSNRNGWWVDSRDLKDCIKFQKEEPRWRI